MNQELIDRIQQDAVTIQRLTADLDSIKQEQASNASDYKEKLQAEELRYSRLLSETTDKLIGCGKRIDSLENQLGKVREFARKSGWTEDKSLADFVSSQAAELAKHRDDAEQIAKSLGSSISLSNKRALEIEALTHEVARERERGNRINAEYEADMKKIMTTANELRRAAYEAPDAFMKRQASEIARLRSRLSEEINDAYKCAGTLGRLSTETVTDFMKRQHAEIEKEQQRNVQMAERLSLVMQDYQDKSQQLLKVQGWHEENLEKIRELTAKHTVKTLAEIFDTAKKHGRRSDETVSQFIIRQEARRKDAGDDSFMEHAYKVADGIGRLEDESLAEFIRRQHEVIQSAAKESATSKKDMYAEFKRLLEVAKSNDQYAKEADDISAANGRTERESLGWFVDRICAESKRKDQTVARLQKVLTKIHDAAKSGGLKQGEKIGAFIERMNEDLYKVRCDAASESMKMGNANKRLQHAYDEADEERKVSKRFHALAVEERNNAQEEVSRLSSELDSTTKRLQAGEFTWNTYGQLCNFATSCGMTGDESVKQFIERKIIEASTVTADRDRIRAELASILSEANKSGRCNGDPVQLLKAGQSDLDARLSAEREAEDIKKRLRSLNEHAALKGMRGDETTAEFITRQHRLAADRQTALDRASETIATLTSDLTSAIVDKALAGNGAKEINRLSALVAELQVELDDARGKYGGIMAQLGNETPLQLIERMQRLAQDQRASTIPHDERAMLVAASADLRKRLEESQKAHANTEHELRGKLRSALATVENQRAAIAEAKQAAEKYTAAVEAAAKLKDWASTIRHKVLVAMVHTKAMAEYDTIMKELDGGKVPQ